MKYASLPRDPQADTMITAALIHRLGPFFLY
jgi:hypothetical protein